MVLGFLRWHPLASAVLVGGAVAGAVGLADSRIDPDDWHPPDPPAMTGPLKRNRELVSAETVVTCSSVRPTRAYSRAPPNGGVFGVTSATPREGALYLKSLFGRYDP
ncbi:hypothetical protein BRD14_06150 [Halobacteriales archaeon SW_5_68_122]|nr:MAG: hypothetical protein BRD14_06150 [Halobacteriales archaeon SW_5_68_122]